jgi:bifunctional non-homologous end joining protein LigD
MLMRSPLARARRRPPGFIPPAKPVLSAMVPTGPNWIHELKHDGYRLLCRKERDRVQLWSRNGRDWTSELVAIAAALRALPSDFVIDGEAVAHCEAGLPDFHRLMARDGQASACLYAFDLLHLGREDLRPLELANRRGVLRSSSAKAPRC